jgi:DNA-binding CsgD family transcriptional regulator
VSEGEAGPPDAPGISLQGRAREWAELQELLDSVRDGLSGAVVMRGEAGIGKTALLDEVVASATDMHVLRLSGIESEMELGYAGLHQLLHPFLGEYEELPPRQREALAIVFGFTDGPAVDRMLVGLAALTILSNVATERPVLVVVDDAHWLDRESSTVLGFVARRLYADRVGLLIALQDPRGADDAYKEVPLIALEGLSPADAATLLARSSGDHVQLAVARRLVAETGGNPLALLELAPRLTPEQLAGQAPMPEPLPVGHRLEDRLLAEVRELPSETQTLLLAAAADTSGEAALLWRAGETLGYDRRAAEPAEKAQMLRLNPRVVFRNPLLRSAIYYGASDIDRRRAHAALADATEVGGDPDRRAWHRAVAANRPDDEVAAELEQAAQRARNRGGCASAAAYLTRAAELSSNPATRASRLLAAASEELAGGAPNRARALLAEANATGLESPLDQIRAKATEGSLLMFTGEPQRAAAILLDAATGLQPFSLEASRGLVLDSLQVAVYAGRFAKDVDVQGVARVALDMPKPSRAEPSTDDLLLEGLASTYLGDHLHAAPPLRSVIERLVSTPSSDAELRTIDYGCWGAIALGDVPSLRTLAARLAAMSSEQGAWPRVGAALYYLSRLALLSGDSELANTHAAEAREIGAALSGVGQLGAVLLTLAWGGYEAQVREELSIARRDAPDKGLGFTLANTEYAMALVELGAGDYRSAFAHFPPPWEQDLFLASFGVADYIEAAVRAREGEVAGAALERFELRVHAADTPALEGYAARCRALLAPNGDCERHYTESIDRLGSVGLEAEVARSRLVYGEWLRRARRAAEARGQLQSALDVFEAMGARAFARRTAAELLAAGGPARQRAQRSGDELTPQEAQVARLAADRATNQEIAARLFISPNTVDYHLRKVYRKLGITSRRELRSKLSPSG